MAANYNEVENVYVAYPESGELNLRIALGACQLRIRPGSSDAWVTGSYRHPHDTLPLKVEQVNGTVRIGQETGMWGGLWGVMDRDSVPRFDLAIDRSRPFALTLELGASDNDIDLGGLPITKLVVRQGAGKVVLDFSTPNPQAMSLLELSSGASGLELRRLANANFSKMSAEGGAAAYMFDFGGEARRDMQVAITTGMAGVEVRTPASTALKAYVQAFMGGVDLGDGFMKKEGAYWNQAALECATPVVNIDAKITMGGIKLTSS